MYGTVYTVFILNGGVFITLIYYILIPPRMLVFMIWSNQTPGPDEALHRLRCSARIRGGIPHGLEGRDGGSCPTQLRGSVLLPSTPCYIGSQRGGRIGCRGREGACGRLRVWRPRPGCALIYIPFLTDYKMRYRLGTFLPDLKYWSKIAALSKTSIYPYEI